MADYAVKVIVRCADELQRQWISSVPIDRFVVDDDLHDDWARSIHEAFRPGRIWI